MALVVGEAAQLPGQLGAPLALARKVVGTLGRDRLGRGLERLVPAAALPLTEIAAGVRHQAVEPGGESRLAAELVDSGEHLRERLLRGVLCILGVVEQVRGQPPHTWLVPFDERRQRTAVAVLGPNCQHHVGERRMRRLAAFPVSESETGLRAFRLPQHRRVLYGMGLRPEDVEPRLRGRFGRPYVWAPVCDSTQELARPLPEGGVAATDLQEQGRGRRGRSWVAPAGTALLFSLALEPQTPAERLPAFSLVAAEAVATACDERALVRWPNDIMLNGRKLAGVLPELRDGKLVLGVGTNVAMTAAQLPAEARVPPTSLLLEGHDGVHRAVLLADLLLELERRYDAFERDGFTGLERDELRGRRVTLAGLATGRSEGVDDQGRLIVDGHAFTSAEVERVDAG